MAMIKLLTGLRRGNIASVAGEVVEVEDGLARRLLERGQATAHAEDAPAAKPVRAARAKAAPKPAAATPPPAEPVTPAQTEPAAEPDTPPAAAEDATVAAANAPTAGEGDAAG